MHFSPHLCSSTPTALLSMIFLLLLFTSCRSIEKTVKESYRYEMYIDWKYVSFEGANAHQTIRLEIDSTDRLRYVGKVVLNDADTIVVHGYEKGGFYPTWYNKPTGEQGMLEIWCPTTNGEIPDSVLISDRDTSGIIVAETTLYRRPRIKCRNGTI